MRTPRHAGGVVIGHRAEAERHLDAATLAGLGARERSLVLHVAACAACRRLLAATEREQRAWTPGAAADAAILGLLREVEVEVEVAGQLAAIQRERREATERVREILARPDSWGTAATEPRYVSLEVAWQLLEVATQEEPMLALRLIDLCGDLASALAGRDPKASLSRQLLVEVRCARAHRLLDLSNRRGAARELHRGD